HLVDAVEAVEAAVHRCQAPERLDGEGDGRGVAVDAPPCRRSRPLVAVDDGHRISSRLLEGTVAEGAANSLPDATRFGASEAQRRVAIPGRRRAALERGGAGELVAGSASSAPLGSTVSATAAACASSPRAGGRTSSAAAARAASRRRA